MSEQVSRIYDKFRTKNDQIDFLMSEQGEMSLDREIIKMMKQLDAEEIIQFTNQFFKSGQNQCPSLHQIITSQLNSRTTPNEIAPTVKKNNQQIEKQSASVGLGQAKFSLLHNSHQSQHEQIVNKLNQLPQILKQMQSIRQVISQSNQIQLTNTKGEQKSGESLDKINFEQFHYDQYTPKLGSDEDYLAEENIVYDNIILQQKNIPKITPENTQNPLQQQEIEHFASSIPTTIEQNQELQFDQVERIRLSQNRYKITYNNGDQYEGQLQEEIKNGWGEYFYSTGQRFVGYFVDDQIQGYGTYFFLSGAQYEGDWSSGMKHGIGILKFSNGDVYEGSFVNDVFHGKGTYKYSNGDVFIGTWKNGLKHGKGTFEYVDGALQIGNWFNDRFQV